MKQVILLGAVVCVALGCAHTATTTVAAGFFGTGNPLEGLAQLKPGEAMRSSSCDPNWENGNGDCRYIKPGDTLVLAELDGPGVITHFWNTIAANERGYSRLLVLRMYWDGEEQPSVEVPFGDFFGIGHGVDQPYQSLPITVTSEGRARNCYWPMPFRKSAKITATNEGRTPINALYWYLDWQKLPSLPQDNAYFHSMYRQEHPAVMGQNYLIADIKGRGHYVGTVLNVRQLTESWWGEGDDFWFIDGENKPRLRGTGSEDYLCDAWGLREMSNLYYGAPLMKGYDAFAKTSSYRWHITDPVPFKKSLRLEIEHKGVTFNPDKSVKSGFEERPDDFSSVAFWYQLEPHKPYPALPPAYDRLYEDWSKLIEAESLIPNVKASDGPVAKQDGIGSGGAQLFWTPGTENQTLEMSLEVPADGNYEVLFLLTSAPDYGVQQIELDGKPLGAPVDLFNRAIATKEYIFAAGELTAGKHVLRFINKGKNGDSKGYFFGFDGVLLNPKK